MKHLILVMLLGISGFSWAKPVTEAQKQFYSEDAVLGKESKTPKTHALETYKVGLAFLEAKDYQKAYICFLRAKNMADKAELRHKGSTKVLRAKIDKSLKALISSVK